MRRRGFTLVELLVAVAISLMLIAVLASTFSYATRAFQRATDRWFAVPAFAIAVVEGVCFALLLLFLAI